MANKYFQLARFKEEYEKLNEKQRLAVDNIEGPMMVIAGPGTGKTQILSARIGKILLETDTSPENILCLTYTDAGVIAMRKRLINFIGPDAYKVNIYTFHAFCNEVIQDNLYLFDKTSLDPVSDLERIQIFKELINAFPKGHALKRYRGDVYYEIGPLHTLFSSMKSEGWTSEYINERISHYIADLPNREDFQYKRKHKDKSPKDKHDLKIQEETNKMAKLQAAVQEFESFQELMRNRSRYDFDDMINWVIKAFQENEDLLRRYQEKFLYILVDEYQDTSNLQNQLVRLLSNYWDKPNIFVVGDDDQSIFRFQGANTENMLGFAKQQNELMTVVLTDNYRSTQRILDVSRILIERNQERLIQKIPGLSKTLVSSNLKIKHSTVEPVLREYETQAQEMMHISLEVERLLSQGVSPARIAVIYKQNIYGEELATYFAVRSIPYYSKRSVNLFDIPLAKKLILLIRYLAAEFDVPYGGDEMLFEILHFDWFHIPPIEISKLSVEVSERRFNESKTSLRRYLFEKSQELPKDLFSKPIHEGLKQASNTLETLLSEASNTTLMILFQQIIRRAGVLDTIMRSPDKLWLMQVLTGLFDFIKEEAHRHPTLDLKQLVSTFELMEKEDLKLPLLQVSGYEKGVNLLTAHGSKGLEFEYVFFAGCNASSWEKKKLPHQGFSLPDTMFDSEPKRTDHEELRRLFYVALTRAEQHLIISYSRFKSDGRQIEPSMFIAEIQEQYPLHAEKIHLDPMTIMQFQALQFAELAPEIEKMEASFVDGLLEKFVMNVTALNNYLKCPLEFYFKNLIRVPSPKNEATEFGSSVHYALEQLFRKMQINGEQFPGPDVFVADFVWYMKRHRESFTLEQFERRMEYGHTVLLAYYDTYIAHWNKIVAIERHIRDVVIHSIPLKGKLDKLEFNGSDVNIVDYKTGDPDKAKTKLLAPNEKDPNGGDYWRQAVFYKMLLDHNQRGWRTTSIEFDFIEPDNKKNYRKQKLVISPMDIATVTNQIIDTWQKIQDHQFYTGCGKEECHWCNFVKTNQLAVIIPEEEEV